MAIISNQNFNKNHSLVTCMLILAMVLILSIFTSIIFGSADLSFSTIIQVVQKKIFNIDSPNLENYSTYIVWEIRLPRALLSIAVGGGLAIAGVAMQALTQNVLAEPYILGVSSGASTMVSIYYFFGGTVIGFAAGRQIFSFIGAIAALVLVYAIGMSGSARASSSRLVLAGMAVSIILNAVSQLFMAMADSATTKNITLWMMGSVSNARMNNIFLPIITSCSCLIFFTIISRVFNLFSLGDETATCLGVNVKLMKKVIIVVIALITGVAVSASGIIGLIGFIVPHISRRLIGTDHRKLFPVSFFIGGIFLLWMDVLARTIMSPQELPVGIFTALCGGPVFVWSLFKQREHRKLGKVWRDGKHCDDKKNRSF